METEKSSIDDKNPVGRLIRSLRLERKLSQKQLAEQAGVSFSFVNQVEGGKQTVRLDSLNKLLSLFGYEMKPTRIDRSKEVGQ